MTQNQKSQNWLKIIKIHKIGFLGHPGVIKTSETDFRFFWSKPIFCNFTVKFGLSGGIPKIANFDCNLAITLPEMVKTIRKSRQNDRQSTSKNFYRGFGGKKTIFDRFVAILPLFWYRPYISITLSGGYW